MPKTDLLQGTLDLLILKILTLGPNHGWGIANRIRQISRDGLNASQGSLYPALHRLELSGDVKSEMTSSENNRRARIYTLTPAGRRRLDSETCQLGAIRSFHEEDSAGRLTVRQHGVSSMFARLVAYLRGIAGRRRISAEVDDELRFHIEQEIEAHVRPWGISSRGETDGTARSRWPDTGHSSGA